MARPVAMAMRLAQPVAMEMAEGWSGPHGGGTRGQAGVRVGGSPGLTPPPGRPGAGPRALPPRRGAGVAACRRVPVAAAQVHLHEAFPLQFTPPSDKPNFSFSE